MNLSNSTISTALRYNPKTGGLHIANTDTNFTQSVQCTWLDAMGQPYPEGPSCQMYMPNRLFANLSELPKGIYQLAIEDMGKSILHKLFIQ